MIDLREFIRYAMSAYDNPHCATLVEFKQDVNKFKRLNKLLSSPSTEEKHIIMTLNHILTLYNVFEREKCTKMMFFKVEKCNWGKLKTFISFLNTMPDAIPEIGLMSEVLPTCNNIELTLQNL